MQLIVYAIAGFSANSGSLYQIPKSFRMNLAMKDVAMRFLAAMFSTAFISLSYGAECAPQGAKPSTSNDPDSTFENEAPYPQYGVWIAPMARTKIECDAYGTPRSWADSPYDTYNRLWTEVLSDTASVAARNDTLPPPYYVDARASAHAESTQIISISSQRVGQAYDGTTIATTYGYAADTIWFEVDGADADSITTVLFKSCGEYSSKYNIYPYVQQSAYFRPLVYPVDDRSWSDPKKDTVAIDDGVKSATYFSSGEESYCVSGKLKIGGARAAYTFNSTASIIGTKSYERIDYNGKKITLDAWDGKLNIATSLDIPKSVKCYSASVQFPGCELRKDEAFDLKVTQAIFDDSAEIKLVFGRTTAIILKRKVPWSHVFDLQIVEAGGIVPVFETNTGGSAFQKIVDETNNSYDLVFYCNQLNAYCNLEKDKKYTISLKLRDIELAAKNVHVEETLPSFVLPFVSVSMALCAEIGCPARNTGVADMQVAHSSFVKAAYPFSDGALKSIPYHINLKNTDDAVGNVSSESCGAISNYPVYIKNLESVFKAVQNFGLSKQASRIIGVVPSQYFQRMSNIGVDGSRRGLPDNVYGLHAGGYPNVLLVARDSPLHISAHELGHSFGFKEGYLAVYDEITDRCVITSRGEEVEGFDVYSKTHILQGQDFMGAPIDLEPWVTNGNWATLMKKVNIESSFSWSLYVTGNVSKNGDASLSEMVEHYAIPDLSPGGTHKIVLRGDRGEVLSEFSFTPGYELHSNAGIFTADGLGFGYVIPYPQGAVKVELIDSTGSVRDSVDPVVKNLRGYIEDTPDECINDFTDSLRLEFYKILDDLEKSVENKNLNEIAKALFYLQGFKNKRMKGACNMSDAVYQDYEKLKSSVERSINRMAIRHDVDLNGFISGDIDGDGDVDGEDLNALTMVRNQPADGINDPRDLVRDGMITVRDEENLIELCTRMNCATE